MDFVEFYKKKIEPFVAVFVLIMLLVMAGMLYNEHILKKEISENCGWGREDYRCYCKKLDVLEIEKAINGFLDLDNIKIVK